MCIKIEPEARYNGRNMEQMWGSSYEFYLHGGVKQDVTEEVTFGNLSGTRMSAGPQGQVIVHFRLWLLVFAFFPFFPLITPIFLSLMNIHFEVFDIFPWIYRHLCKFWSVILCVYMFLIYINSILSKSCSVFCTFFTQLCVFKTYR